MGQKYFALDSCHSPLIFLRSVVIGIYKPEAVEQCRDQRLPYKHISYYALRYTEAPATSVDLCWTLPCGDTDWMRSQGAASWSTTSLLIANGCACLSFAVCSLSHYIGALHTRLSPKTITCGSTHMLIILLLIVEKYPLCRMLTARMKLMNY